MKSDERNKPAFPTAAGHTAYSNGMSLRDYFAGQALAGIMANKDTVNNFVPVPSTQDQAAKMIACQALRIADAMIKECS